MRKAFYWAFLAGMIGLLYSGTGGAQSRKAPAKKSSSSSARAKSKSNATSRKKSSSRRPAVTWRNRQMHPTPQRYKEIQEALVAKGYLPSGAANGNWDDSSVDALKRFQADQNLESSGKINSLSLIALGLGPKREPEPAPKPAGQVSDPSPAGK